MLRFIIPAFFIISISFPGFSQKTPAKRVVDPKEAELKYFNENYKEALADYLILLEAEPGNEKYNFIIAVCYLKSNIDKKKAIPYLETILKAENKESDALYMLARAYHYAERFDDAIKTYTAFKERGKGTSDYLKNVDHDIQYCYNAKEITKFPINVTFENLGRNINSEYPEYYPFVPADESFLLFNTKRQGLGNLMDLNGAFTSDIYISKVTEGIFQKGKSISPSINTTDGEEEVVGLSANGDYMAMYFDNLSGFGDIFICESDKSRNFRKPEAPGKNINSSGVEMSASITSDGNTIYFTSDRKGGLGGTDIYVSRRLPSGEWGEAQNLGPVVNTEYDEDFPTVSDDERVLYFSSKGHTSIGGFDIFKVIKEDETSPWSSLRNIGYPINNAEDNMNLRFSKSGRYGYISALRQEGIGDLDIYRVTFNDVEPLYTVLKGWISSADSTKKIDFKNIIISVEDSKTNDLIGNYLPSPAGSYVIALPPGSYTVLTELEGFNTAKETVNIMDKISYKTEIEKNIKLLPKGYQPPTSVKKDTKATGTKPEKK